MKLCYDNIKTSLIHFGFNFENGLFNKLSEDFEGFKHDDKKKKMQRMRRIIKHLNGYKNELEKKNLEEKASLLTMGKKTVEEYMRKSSVVMPRGSVVKETGIGFGE